MMSKQKGEPDTDRREAEQKETYERNPVNDCSLGKDFEVNVAIYSLLTLLQNEQRAIAIEYKQAPAKFDDVVLRVHNGTSYEYYYRQLKHKDVEKDPEACLTWNDLLRTKKNPKDTNPPFGIPWYYEISQLSAAHQQNPSEAYSTDIKELAFVTNYSLFKSGTGTAEENNLEELAEENNLEELAQKLLYPTAREQKYPITEGDLNIYFQEWSDPSSWRSPSSVQKSYKLTKKAIEAITKGTQAGLDAATNSLDLSSYGVFLGKLVFHVSMPHVSQLKKINQSLLKAFLPFHMNVLNEKYGYITDNFMRLFAITAPATAPTDTKKGKSYQSKWASFECRRLLFENMAKACNVECTSIELKIPFGLKNNEMDDIKRPWGYLATEMLDTKTIQWKDKSPMKLINIFNADSNPNTVTLKVLNTLLQKNASLVQRRITEKHITDQNSVERTIEYFEQLDKDDVGTLACENFCCVIAISPVSGQANLTRNEIVECLISKENLRKWIRFVIITQLPVTVEGERGKDIDKIEDDQLHWRDLTEEFKNFLMDKTLYLDNGMETNLRRLGFERETIGDWLHPRALAEMIVHDKEKPLSLGLPRKDTNVSGTDYVERSIKLPLVMNSAKAQRGQRLFTCDEKEFEGIVPNNNAPQKQQPIPISVYQHLLTPVKTERYKENNACLYVKSKENRSILEHRECIVPAKDSDYTIKETVLLNDKENFGTGSKDNRLIVIVDYPGKGKSWLLSSITNRFLDTWLSHHPNYLLLRINLREIKHWREQMDGLTFLLAHAKLLKGESASLDGNTNLSLAILKEKFNNDPASIFLLLDGYDEINDSQRKSILFTTTTLMKAKGIKRIIITSRPENTLENELERHFKQFSLHLKNFDKKDQVDYLTRRWNSKLEKRGTILMEGQTEKTKTYAEAFVSFAAGVLTDENKTFLDIPLQCWIFSECFYSQLEEYLESCNEPSEDKAHVPQFDETNLQILSLYDRFYEAKIDVLLTEKANIPPGGNEALVFLRNVMAESFLSSMMRLSVIHMMEQTDDVALICNSNWIVYQSKMKKYRDEEDEDSISEYGRDLKLAMKLGVVQSPEDNNTSISDIKTGDIKFLHRTFAEYFFARALLRNFIQEKSEFFDGAPDDDVRGKRFKMIDEKIFAKTELAGVRRFLNEMLAKYLPTMEERCPFSKDSRAEVLKKWPVIGHERFNEYLAREIIAKNAGKLTQLELCNELKVSELSEQFYERLRNQVRVQEGLDSIKMRNFENVPYIASTLIHCIKEYALRDSTSGSHREILAYSFALSSLAWVLGNPEEKRITSSLLQWFDRVAESSFERSNIFSKWYVIVVNILIREKSERLLSAFSSIFASTCDILRYHSADPHFDDNIYAIASLMLAPNTGERSHVEAFQFLKVDLSVTIDLLEKKDRISDALFQAILVSLGNHSVLSTALLDRLADTFLLQLKNNIERINKLGENQAECNVERPTSDIIDSYAKFLGGNIIHPKAFITIVTFFMSHHASKLTNPTEFLNVALDYVAKIQLATFKMNYLVDLLFALLIADDGLPMVRADHKYSNEITYKMMSTLTMFYYFFASKVVMSHLPPDRRKKTQLDVFTTEAGQKSLTAYAFAKCCCECSYLWFTGFGIHFPCIESDTDEEDGKFKTFFTDLLELLWSEKGEIEFIDFLMQNGVELRQINETGAMLMDASEMELGDAAHETRATQLFNAESILRAVHLSKLPCLLFSKLVSEYIPQRLSLDGLKHLAEVLKKVPLFTCLNICYKGQLKNLPDVSDENMSLWEGIMQSNDASFSFECSQAEGRLKTLRKKLQDAISI